MKTRLIQIFLMLPFLLVGQVNLVPNPSFEDTLHCASDSTVVKAKRWYRPSACGTPDFYYPLQQNVSCFTLAPNNWGGGDYLNSRGFQMPRTGDAYCGFGVSMGNELLAIGLSDSMIAGKMYDVSFYTSLAEVSISGQDQINLCFMQDSLTDFNFATCWSYLGTLHVDAGDLPGNIIIDTLAWILMRDTFIAVGGEKYMIVGNIDTASAQYFYLNTANSIGSYYYFDDFDVHCIDCIADTFEPPTYPEIIVTPNIGNGEITLSGNFLEGAKFEVYDLLGQLVYYNELQSGNQTQQIFLQLSAGVYSYRVVSNNNVLKADKLVVLR